MASNWFGLSFVNHGLVTVNHGLVTPAVLGLWIIGTIVGFVETLVGLVVENWSGLGGKSAAKTDKRPARTNKRPSLKNRLIKF